MRLIDADALKKQIEDFHCKNCDNYNFVRCRACHIDDAISYLDEAPTVNGWISVKERLPMVSGVYLTTDGGISLCLHYSAKYKAFNAFDELKDNEHVLHVEYWMNIPEPPKEDENG